MMSQKNKAAVNRFHKRLAAWSSWCVLNVISFLQLSLIKAWEFKYGGWSLWVIANQSDPLLVLVLLTCSCAVISLDCGTSCFFKKYLGIVLLATIKCIDIIIEGLFDLSEWFSSSDNFLEVFILHHKLVSLLLKVIWRIILLCFQYFLIHVLIILGVFTLISDIIIID